MIEVSQDFKEMSLSPVKRGLLSSIKVTRPNGDVEVFDNPDEYRHFKIIQEADIAVGGMAEAHIQIAGKHDFKGCKLALSYGYDLDGKPEMIELGEFKVIDDQNFDVGQNVTQVIAYDALIDFTVAVEGFEPHLPLPIKQFAEEMGEHVGVPVVIDDYDFTVDREPYNETGHTYRDIVDDIAEITGTLPIVKDGKLVFKDMDDGNLIPKRKRKFEGWAEQNKGKNYVENWDFTDDKDIVFNDYYFNCEIKNNILYAYQKRKEANNHKILELYLGDIPKGEYIYRLKMKAYSNCVIERHKGTNQTNVKVIGDGEWHIYEVPFEVVTDDVIIRIWNYNDTKNGDLLFEFDWVQVTPKDNQHLVVELEQNKSMPEWNTNEASEIKIFGGDQLYKYYLAYGINKGIDHYFMLYIKNTGTNNFIVSDNTGITYEVIKPKESKLIIKKGIGRETSTVQIQFRSEKVNENIQAIVYKPYVSYEYKGKEKLGADNMGKYDIKEKFGEVDSLVLSRQPQNDNVYSTGGASTEDVENELKFINNQLVDDKRELVVDDMFERYKGLTLSPFEMKTVGIGYLEIGDTIYTEVNGNYGEHTILGKDIEVGQGIREILYCDEPMKTTTKYEYATDSEIKAKQTEIELDKQKQEISIINKNVGNWEGKLSEIETTIDTILAQVEYENFANLWVNSSGIAGTAGYTYDTEPVKMMTGLFSAVMSGENPIVMGRSNPNMYTRPATNIAETEFCINRTGVATSTRSFAIGGKKLYLNVLLGSVVSNGITKISILEYTDVDGKPHRETPLITYKASGNNKRYKVSVDTDEATNFVAVKLDTTIDDVSKPIIVSGGMLSMGGYKDYEPSKKDYVLYAKSQIEMTKNSIKLVAEQVDDNWEKAQFEINAANGLIGEHSDMLNSAKFRLHKDYGAEIWGSGLTLYNEAGKKVMYFDTAEQVFTFAGKIIAELGEIAGFTLNKERLTSSQVVIDGGRHDGAMWVGNNGAWSHDTPFRVYKNGLLVATNAQITGEINAERGKIGDFSLSRGELTSTLVRTTKRFVQADLDRTKKIIMGDIRPTAADYATYDVDGDGRIHAIDYVMIKNAIAGQHNNPMTVREQLILGAGKTGINTNQRIDGKMASSWETKLTPKKVETQRVIADIVETENLLFGGKSVLADSNGWLKVA